MTAHQLDFFAASPPALPPLPEDRQAKRRELATRIGEKPEATIRRAEIAMTAEGAKIEALEWRESNKAPHISQGAGGYLIQWYEHGGQFFLRTEHSLYNHGGSGPGGDLLVHGAEVGTWSNESHWSTEEEDAGGYWEALYECANIDGVTHWADINPPE